MAEKMYLTANEVQELTGLKTWRVYKLMGDLNKELAKQGKYVIPHVVSRKALLKFLDEGEE